MPSSTKGHYDDHYPTLVAVPRPHPPLPSRIVVAMSGGVDSSTVAAMLKAEGHEVIGITLQLYDHGLVVGKKGACCAGKDIYDAQMAAERLSIPHYVFDYESAFKEEVIDKFIDGYIKGETPIPCILCNQKVKFRDLLRAARQLNADAMATGHYVRKIVNDFGESELHKAVDENKDQSYFLFTTTQEQLDFLMFPLGGMNKDETRKLARSYGLELADKPDSQDICFVPNGDYRQVIEKIRPGSFIQGNIVDSYGAILGGHNGIINYTVGQRRGIGIANEQAIYVVAIDAAKNEVIVGTKDKLKGKNLLIRDINWLGREIKEDDEVECLVKLRSTHKGSTAKLRMLDNDMAYVTLYEEYFAITPGQACVVYGVDSSLNPSKRQLSDLERGLSQCIDGTPIGLNRKAHDATTADTDNSSFIHYTRVLGGGWIEKEIKDT